MNETLSLFDQPEQEEHCSPSKVTAQAHKSLTIDGDFPHFYARYGLAAALVQSNLPVSDLSEEIVCKALLKIVQDARDGFRMEPSGPPIAGTSISFGTMTAKQLLAALGNTAEKNKMAVRGRYLFPHLVSSDKSAGGLWKVTSDWEEELKKKVSAKGKKSRAKFYDLKRGILPTSGDCNNGIDDAKPPRGDFWETACCLAATLTPLKAASYSRVPGKNPGSGTNTAILPDLNLEELHYFIGFFQVLQIAAMEERMSIGWNINTSKPYLKYRRPPLCQGNFPNAPDDGATFGAVGLLGAIGEWAKQAPHREKAIKVLDSLQDCAIYLVSYDNTRVTRFNHHVVALAKRGELGEIVDKFARTSQLWADTEYAYPNKKDRSFQSTYLLFHRAFAQFLERFTLVSFGDFFAYRAEYPADLQLVLEEFFMNQQNTPKHILDSVRRLGQHINGVASGVAFEEVGQKRASSKEEEQRYWAAYRKEKSKIFVELETGIMSAPDIEILISTLSTRVGRLLHGQFPHDAEPFITYALGGGLTLHQTKHLLISYMRLQKEKLPAIAQGLPSDDGDTEDDGAFTDTDEQSGS